MANFNSVHDLKKNVLTRVGELTDGTSDYDGDILKYLSSIHQSVISGGNEFGVEVGEDWSWARAKRPIILTLEPAYETGTVALTNGSLTGTFSAGPTASVVGWHIKLDDRSEVFKILLHTAGETGFSIDAPYTDETISGSSFKVFKLDYELYDDNFLIDSDNKRLDYEEISEKRWTFSRDLYHKCKVNADINGNAMTEVAYASSSTATMVAIAAQLVSDFSEVASGAGSGKLISEFRGGTAGVDITGTDIVVTNNRTVELYSEEDNFETGNLIDMDVDGVAMTQVAYTGSHINTMTALAAQLVADFAQIEASAIDSYYPSSRNLLVVGTDDQTSSDLIITNISVTGGASQPTLQVTDTGLLPTVVESDLTVVAQTPMTFTEGMYTAATLATHVASVMTSSVGGGGAFTGTFDSRSKKFNFVTDTAARPMKILAGSGDFIQNSIARTVGLLNKDYASAISWDSEVPIKSVSRLIDPFIIHKGQAMDSDDDRKVYFNAPDTLSREYPLTALKKSNPTRFTVIKRDHVSGVYTVRFNSYPAAQLRLEIEHIETPMDLQDTVNDFPLIPVEYRILLEHGAAYYIMLDKNDSRADSYLRLAQAKLQALINANRKQTVQTSKNSGRLIPRIEQRASRRRLKTTSGLDVI